MRSLLAVVSAHTRPAFTKTLRETWIPLFHEKDCDVKLFFGRGAGREPLEDEVFLDCDDSYEGLPEKVREILRWSYKNDYDKTLKCDDDVVIHPVRFREVLYCGGDFSGPQASLLGPFGKQIAVPYGFCYWLSRRSMEIMVDSDLPTDNKGNDEWWVSRKLFDSQGIRLINDRRYGIYRVLSTSDVNPPKRALRRIRMFDNIFPESTVAWCIHSWAEHPSAEDRCKVFKKVFADYVGKIAVQNQ